MQTKKQSNTRNQRAKRTEKKNRRRLEKAHANAKKAWWRWK